MNDDGEPIGRGQLDGRSAEAKALHDAGFAIAVFTWVVLVNGILAFFLIELFQAIGWWETAAVEGAHEATSQMPRRFTLEV